MAYTIDVVKYDVQYMRNQYEALNAARYSNDLVESILNHRMTVRMDAIEKAKKEQDPKLRAAFKPFLIHTIKTDPLMPPRGEPINGESADYSPKRVSLRIMAEWADKEMIPVFLEHLLIYCPYRCLSLSMRHNPMAFPSTLGLIRIGGPSIEPCLDKLTTLYHGVNTFNPDNKEVAIQLNLLFVIRKILGKNKAIELFENELVKLRPTNPEAAKNLQNLLRYCRENDIEKAG